MIDDYITPLLKAANPIFSGLLRAIAIMAGIYLVGVVTSLFYNRTMVTISQGILKEIRDEMFAHMQTLSIKYFDTHTHGDVMSRYTNDTDALRMMISQSVPQVLAALITVISVFFAMLFLSPLLTLLVVIWAALMLTIASKIGGNSATYFVAQQSSIGVVNGYIEEMINGQKVVKVFCHEGEAKEGFDVRNEELCENATQANKFANILMPIMGNMGALVIRARCHCRRRPGD